MGHHVADRIRNLKAYPFALIDEKVDALRAAGVDPIDFGVGDPTLPTPGDIRERCKAAVDERAATGYPSYIGSLEFRQAAAEWIRGTFGVALDPKTQVTSTIGSKEGIFHFPLGFVEPGDTVLCPSPGYPPYPRGTLFAGGRPYNMPLLKKNGFLPDLDAIPDDVAEKARILWLCYPGAPTGALAPDAFFEKAIAWGRERNIIVVNDEAYIDLYYGKKPRSILEFGTEGVVAFFSMSKRSAMTGWRIGWTAGDADIIATFRKVKTNIDSGTPTFIQDAAIAGLKDEEHVAGMRAHYKEKRDLLAACFREMGLPDSAPDASIHYWQELPEGLDALAFAERLLSKDIAVVGTPGPWLADECDGGVHPGKGFFRLSMVASVEDTKRACERMLKHKARLLA